MPTDPNTVPTQSPIIAIPEEVAIPLWSGMQRLVQSSKALVVAMAVLAVSWLCYYGKVTGPEALDFTKWLVIAFIGAVAIEDGSQKLITRPDTSGNATRTAMLLQQLLPLFSSLIAPKPPQAQVGDFPPAEQPITPPPAPATPPGAVK
jgi:hypothetical protein